MSTAQEVVIVLDDDPSIHEIVCWMLQSQPYRVHSATSLQQFEKLCTSTRPAVLLLDWHLSDHDGLELMAQIQQSHPTTPIVLVTAHSSPEIAARSIKCGAFDFLPKPLDEARLVATVAQAVEHGRMARRLAELESDEGGDDCFERMIGSSTPMQKVFDLIRSVAPTDATVLVTGESGCGKELVAQAIHRRSRRAAGPFVALNMAALPRDLVEATLFGHEKGAFTGADRRRIGACEEAAGGTLFLDEISEMPLELQAKLLRFLQERRFRRVGADSDSAADVRVVSATNRDPQDLVVRGSLRADLYYRLNVVPVHLPPLRQRAEDIDLLATHAVRRFAARYAKSFTSIDPAAMAMLRASPWPGNVRELLHMMERIVVLHDGPMVTSAMLPEALARLAGQARRGAGGPQAESQVVLPLALVERQAIERALRVCGSIAEAARRLDISEATIYRKLKSYGLERAAYAGAAREGVAT